MVRFALSGAWRVGCVAQARRARATQMLNHALTLFSAMVLAYGVDAPPTGVSVGLSITNNRIPDDAAARQAFLALNVEANTHIDGVLFDGTALSVLIVFANSGPQDVHLDVRRVARWSLDVWRGNQKLSARVLGPSHVLESGADSLHTTTRLNELRTEILRPRDKVYWQVELGSVDDYPESVAIEVRLSRSGESALPGKEVLDVLDDRQAFIRLSPRTKAQKVERLMQLATEHRAPWRWEPQVAERFLREALELDPDNCEIQIALATSLFDQGRTEAAASMLSAAADKLPSAQRRAAAKSLLRRWREPVVLNLRPVAWPKAD